MVPTLRNLSLTQKSFFSLAALNLVVTALLSIALSVNTRRSLHPLLQAEVAKDINVVWASYNAKLTQLQLGMAGLANNPAVIQDIRHSNTAALRAILTFERASRQLDILTIVNRDRRIIAGANATRTGEHFDPAGLVTRVFRARVQHAGAEIWPLAELQRESPLLAARGQLPRDPFSWAGSTRQDRPAEGGLVQVEITPVFDRGELLGAIIAADLLNGRPEIPQHALQILGEGVVSMAQGDTVISSTLLNPERQAFIARQLPAEIVDRVLVQREPFSGQTTVLGSQLEARCEPIINARSLAIGALCRGLPAEPFWRMISQRQWQVIGIVFLFGLVAMLPILWFARRVIGEPLRRVAQASRAIATGDLSVAVPQRDADDEVGQLSRDFNAMTSRLRDSRAALEEANARLELEAGNLSDRNRELAILNEIATTVGQSRHLYDILEKSIQIVIGALGLDAGWVFLLREKGNQFSLVHHRGLPLDFADTKESSSADHCLCGRAVADRQTVVSTDLQRCFRGEVLLREGLRSHLSVPLFAKKQVLGILNLAGKERTDFSQQELHLLTAIGNQLGVAIQNALLWEELSEKEAARGQLLEKLIAIQEEERKRIARELHDETGQSLTSLLVSLKVLGKTASWTEARPQIAELQALTTRTLEEIHRLSVELRPSILDDLGLVPALRAYTREYQAKFNLPVDFEVQGLEGRLPPGTELIVYRLVQEALTNTAKYARATSVRLSFEVLGEELFVQVRDDGIGFDPKILLRRDDARPHLGILGMQERIALVNGRLSVESVPGRGTSISLVIPVKVEGASTLLRTKD